MQEFVTEMEKMDANKRWVRVLRKTENGFVEFEFFVSDADLYVELILPEAAFQEFCISNKIIIVDGDKPNTVSDVQHNGLLKLVK